MVLVTAPTGQIGSQLVSNLLTAREPVRVVVRDPERLPVGIRRRVEVVQGSHGEAAVIRQACKGVEAVFWLVPPDPRASSVNAAYVDFTRPACEAFLSEKIQHVVGVSSLGRGKSQASHAGLITASLAMDDLIAGTGVSYRALTMPSFMDNLLRQTSSIKNQGVFASPIPGDLKAATCATFDVAAAAAELLLDRSWNGTGGVPVLGPEDLCFNEMAQIMSEVLRKPVRFEAKSNDTLKAELRAYGQSEAMVEGVAEMLSAVSQGLYSNEPRTPEAASQMSFRQWCANVLVPALLR